MAPQNASPLLPYPFHISPAICICTHSENVCNLSAEHLPHVLYDFSALHVILYFNPCLKVEPMEAQVGGVT